MYNIPDTLISPFSQRVVFSIYRNENKYKNLKNQKKFISIRFFLLKMVRHMTLDFILAYCTIIMVYKRFFLFSIAILSVEFRTHHVHCKTFKTICLQRTLF